MLCEQSRPNTMDQDAPVYEKYNLCVRSIHNVQGCLVTDLVRIIHRCKELPPQLGVITATVCKIVISHSVLMFVMHKICPAYNV